MMLQYILFLSGPSLSAGPEGVENRRQNRDSEMSVQVLALFFTGFRSF